jgi:hypothetical protein
MQRGQEKKKPMPQKVESGNLISDILSLRAGWAFVVQFRESARSSSLPSSRRVEHIMSGQTIPFSGPNDLFEFFGRMLIEQNQACRRTMG